MHGGLDAPNRETLPVVGQKQIHNRIQQLNFRDCHAKISQVGTTQLMLSPRLEYSWFMQTNVTINTKIYIFTTDNIITQKEND